MTKEEELKYLNDVSLAVCLNLVGQGIQVHPEDTSKISNRISEISFSIADAMLKELLKRKE